MKIELRREFFSDESTIGRLYIDGHYFCYTLEDTCREINGKTFPGCKVQNETAIPRGEYQVIIDYSQHFHRELPHILNVPYFDGVRIHAGNSARDTEGCVLLGRTRNVNWIGQSQAAFIEFFDKFEQAYNHHEGITILITNAEEPNANHP